MQATQGGILASIQLDRNLARLFLTFNELRWVGTDFQPLPPGAVALLAVLAIATVSQPINRGYRQNGSPCHFKFE